MARVRYIIWFAASIKFLIPFSLLISLGNLLPHQTRPVAPSVYSAVGLVEEPFNVERFPSGALRANVQTVHERSWDIFSYSLAIVWLCGSCAVLFIWWIRWRGVSEGLHQARPAVEGRELEILSRLQAGYRNTLSLFLSTDRVEPTIYGVFAPALVWPEQLSESLSDEHIEAIIVHELAHVSRRDNLTATIHMAVEAAFWFHPLIWWMERQMLQEREQACDEVVLDTGRSPQTFAESLLKTCRFCLESPLACTSGVTGADLRHRVAGIVIGRTLLRMSWPRKVAAMAAASLVVIAPVMLGLNLPDKQPLQAKTPTYDVVSIKISKAEAGSWSTRANGDRYSATNISLRDLLAEATGIRREQISGIPEPIASARFNIEAKVLEADVKALDRLTAEQRGTMLLAILLERFKLSEHLVPKILPIYALEITKNGPKFKVATSQDNKGGGTRMHDRKLKGTSITMATLSDALTKPVGRPVIDKTGLTALYDLSLQWSADDASASLPDAPPLIFTAVKEQLGLKLEASKGPVETLVVDHIEMPSEN